MSVRFSPDACPGCGEPLRPKYSAYRHGTRHWLFPAALIGGAVATLASIPLILWAIAHLAQALFGGLGLTQRERGVLYFLMVLACAAAVGQFIRLGWRAIHRLPRTFATGCGTCTWTGPCRVYETYAE